MITVTSGLQGSGMTHEHMRKILMEKNMIDYEIRLQGENIDYSQEEQITRYCFSDIRNTEVDGLMFKVTGLIIVDCRINVSQHSFKDFLVYSIYPNGSIMREWRSAIDIEIREINFFNYLHIYKNLEKLDKIDEE